MRMSEFPAVIARPFHFLIQEQAKCMVAIKELQDQVLSLQDFRTVLVKTTCIPPASAQLRPGMNGERLRLTNGTGRVLPTIRDGSPASAARRGATGSSGSSNDSTDFDGHQQHASSPKTRRSSDRGTSKRNGSTVTMSAATSQKFIVVAQGKNWLRIRPYSGPGADSELEDSDEPVSTSDSVRSGGDSLRDSNHRLHRRTGVMERKDSGFSTDQQLTTGEQMDRSVGTSCFSANGEDELLSLLDEIEARSHQLRHEVDRVHIGKDGGAKGMTNGDQLSSVAEVLSFGDMGLQPQELLNELDCTRKERDQLLERLHVAEERAISVHLRVHQLEEKLRTATTEREQLDMRIHGMHMQFVRPNGLRKDVMLSDGASSDSGPSSLPDGLLRGRVHVKPNTARISAVLRETQSLELQRQLLTAIMENEVLKTQLEQITKDWNRRSRQWQQEIDIAQHEVHNSRSALDRTKLELQSERARLRMLQRALQATHINAPHLNPFLAQSLQALGQSLADHYKDKATNTVPEEISGSKWGILDRDQGTSNGSVSETVG